MSHPLWTSGRSALLCLAVAIGALNAQQEIWRVQTTFPNQSYGFLSSLGDIDGDGLPDFGHRILGTFNVMVYSGATFAPLVVINAISGESNFVVRKAGDFDGDGEDEVFLETLAAIRVFKPLTGQTTLTLGGGVARGALFVDDVDGDGIADFAVAAVAPDTTGTGRLDMISGSNGSTLYSVIGPSPSGQFSVFKATLDDIDGDGVNDLAVGAPGELFFPSGNGEVLVLSGATGATIHYLLGPGLWSRFGASVEAVGDHDGDSIRDFSVFAPQGIGVGQPNPLGGYGQGFIFSSASGALLHTYNCGPPSGGILPCGTAPFSNNFGTQRLADVDDFDGDGFEDMAITLRGTPFDPINLLSGRSLQPLQSFAAGINVAPDQNYGFSGLIGDLTGDGIPEVGVIGGGASAFTPVRAFVAVYSLSPVGTHVFGAPCNTVTTPKIGCSGRPEPGHSITVNVSGITPTSQAFLLVGQSNTMFGPWALPYPLHAVGLPNCLLRVSPDLILPAFTDSTIPTKSYASLSAAIPLAMSLTGLSVYVQWAVADGSTFSLSRGLDITFF